MLPGRPQVLSRDGRALAASANRLNVGQSGPFAVGYEVSKAGLGGGGGDTDMVDLLVPGKKGM